MMSDEQTQLPNDDSDNDSGENQRPDELTMLKQRARMMGLTFSNNISVETLKQKIQDKMDGGSGDDMPKTDELPPPAPPLVDPQIKQAAPGKVQTLRQKLVAENMRLIRLRITNLDPKKKDLPGEIFTVANEYLGTVRKFVPFGEVTEDGYHVPYCIYKMMKARKFLNIRTFKDRKNQNQIKVEQNWAQEFALEVLPPLTPEEIGRLANAQAAAGSSN